MTVEDAKASEEVMAACRIISKERERLWEDAWTDIWDSVINGSHTIMPKVRSNPVYASLHHEIEPLVYKYRRAGVDPFIPPFKP